MASYKDGVLGYIAGLGMTGVLVLPRLLPYSLRVPVVGWLASQVVARLFGYDARIRKNLALVCPEMPEAEIRRMCRAVPDSAGRTLIEIFSADGLRRRLKDIEITGEGYAAMIEAQAEGRPVILISGHFGNYDAFRMAFSMRGFQAGALYRPFKNKFFNRYYVRMISEISSPIFARGRRGLAEMLTYLRGGNVIALLVDQHVGSGVPLRFFGQPAMTTLSPAEMALKYDALLIPGYCFRKENGLDFDLVMEAPIPHSDPRTMMQTFNDALEERIRANMDQWLWLHRRWKIAPSADALPPE